MKQFDVIIDFESLHLNFQAETEEEANEKAMKHFKSMSVEDKMPDWWIGETDEVKE